MISSKTTETQDLILFVVQLVSVVATVAAAVFAAIALVVARRQERKSLDALRAERRIDFQLTILRDLADVSIRGDNVTWATAHFRILASMLPLDVVPLARASVKLDGTPEHDKQVEAVRKVNGSQHPRTTLRAQIQDEIIRAVEKLIDSRP